MTDIALISIFTPNMKYLLCIFLVFSISCAKDEPEDPPGSAPAETAEDSDKAGAEAPADDRANLDDNSDPAKTKAPAVIQSNKAPPNDLAYTYNMDYQVSEGVSCKPCWYCIFTKEGPPAFCEYGRPVCLSKQEDTGAITGYLKWKGPACIYKDNILTEVKPVCGEDFNPSCG